MPIEIRKPIPIPNVTHTAPPKAAVPPPKAPVTPKKTAKPKSEPTKRLPIARINFTKQLEIIRVYGIKSQNGKAAHYNDVGEVVGIHGNTVSLMVGFLVENGFLERIANATIAARPVIDFAQAYSWSPETAPRKLAPIIRNSWFGKLLLEKLAFRPMTESETVADLAGAISASPEYRSQVRTLVDYAAVAGLVRRDGNQLFLGEEAAMPSPSAASERPQPPSDQRDDVAPRSTAHVATGFMNTEGAVQFHVSIKVSMQEMSGWAPDRIGAFFAGLAQVLAAKKGTEEIEK
jgi:hypothetical protein